MKSKKGLLYVLAFLYTLHTTPTLYINSSFLGQYIADSKVGLVYTVSSILVILGLIVLPAVICKWGNFKTFIGALLIETICLFFLAFSGVPAVLIGTFILSSFMRSIAFFNLDIFLENTSTVADTGSIRSIFLTSMSVATLLGPLIASFVLTDQGFSTLYVISATIMLPVIFIALRRLKSSDTKTCSGTPFLATFSRLLKNRDLYAVNAINFLLNFFYSWMVIYTPIYLHEHIGFTFPEVGIIIAIALLPFILFDYLWGWLADRKIGEKEMLVAGFIIAAGASATMAFTQDMNLALWATILFVTRIGASLIETMAETYLFKKISVEDTDMLSFFRITSPLAYIIGPLVASALFLIIDFNFLFLILGAIMLWGVRYSLMIKDTL